MRTLRVDGFLQPRQLSQQVTRPHVVEVECRGWNRPLQFSTLPLRRGHVGEMDIGSTP
jgi:hypothetical protein